MGCASSTTVVGGYSVGDSVFYGGPGRPAKAGSEQLVFGAAGEVVGQTCRGDIMVAFSSGVGRVSVRPLELSRSAPAVPGGYCLGDRVYYGGPARKYPNGDQLLFSAQGHVAGRSCVGDGMDSERLAVMFPQHRDSKAVRLALLSREPPVIPGGYSVGDRVFWCGMNWTFPNGDRLRFGAKGEVAGRSCVGDGMDDERVAVNFPGNKGAVAMRLPEISHEPPVIPGGYRIGDRVFYAYPNWRAPDGHVLLFGVQGKVIGRSCIGDGKDDERVWVLFPGLGYGCICLEQISNEPPVIPGGYSLGDRVYYGGPNRSAGCNGDRLTFGALGEVAGRATSSRSSHKADVAVVFPGNEDAVDVRLAEISREAPVIPGGYCLSDRVYYGGEDCKYPNGDRLTFGARGGVAGRSCQGDGKDHERVAVLLPGNRSAAHLHLSEIAREPPARLQERLTERFAAASAQQGEGAERRVDIAELAIVYQTASGAGIPCLAEAALQSSLAQVERGQRQSDLALLSEICRAAEDMEWPDLRERARLALEDVALPRVLAAAEASEDTLGQLAVEQRARARGQPALAEQAALLLCGAGAHAGELPDLRADACLLRKSTDAEAVLMEQMQLLLDETYTGWGGYGKRTRTRDRPNEKVADRLEVASVVHLRNMESYLNYCVRRRVIAAELPEDFRRDWGVRTNSGDLSPARHRNGPGMSHLQLGPVDPDLNEHYLWHGTGPAEAAGIADAGFDIEQAGSSRGALFGRGLYFAESCLKADEYVRADDRGWFPMILCRVTLGNVNYCDAEDPWELRDTFRVSCRAGAGGHHSVLGDREKVRQTFREFVVFDAHQAYPEYIVWYTRK
mmetsp:Transcript_78219/g.253320  ORF Transcript_78219/g.253320 Transcript_78219/m.253320 type:complete len:846 (-) Transcript_78219:170-2707(-)